MKETVEAGIKKKSFELYYNGGSIWCEHLDSMGEYKEKVIEKFKGDIRYFSRPSMTSFMIINLDETEIDEEIVSCIIDGITACGKRFVKIAFVGVKDRADCRAFRVIHDKNGCAVSFFEDYEKAKEWVLPVSQ